MIYASPLTRHRAHARACSPNNAHAPQDKERVLRLLFAKINQSQMGAGSMNQTVSRQVEVDQDDEYAEEAGGDDVPGGGGLGGSSIGSSRGGHGPGGGRISGYTSLRQPGLA